MKQHTNKQRREAIKSLIKSQAIENQTMLVDLLKEKYDIATNQSIVSRDLQDLGVSKKKYKDIMVYELFEGDPNKEIFQRGLVNIEHNEVMILIIVLPGLAGFVSEHLDMVRETVDVLGTIAGENMIFVMPKSIKTIEETNKKVCEVLYFKKTED